VAQLNEADGERVCFVVMQTGEKRGVCFVFACEMVGRDRVVNIKHGRRRVLYDPLVWFLVFYCWFCSFVCGGWSRTDSTLAPTHLTTYVSKHRPVF